MIIKLSPIRMDGTLTVSKEGDALTVNGVEYDFTPLPAGATLPAEAIDSEWIKCCVERTLEGELILTLRLPHRAEASQAALFPEPLVDPEDGPLELPV